MHDKRTAMSASLKQGISRGHTCQMMGAALNSQTLRICRQVAEKARTSDVDAQLWSMRMREFRWSQMRQKPMLLAMEAVKLERTLSYQSQQPQCVAGCSWKVLQHDEKRHGE